MFKEIWPYLIPFISSLLSAGVGYWLAGRNRAIAETSAQKEKREKAEKEQTAEVAALRGVYTTLAASFEERKRLADAARTEDKLKFESDLAAVTGILKEFTEAQRLLTGIATNVANHEKRLDRHEADFRHYNDTLDTIRDHLNQLALRAGPRHAP
ncbi:hypothetical protein [Hymenobacter mucosus]|uniref:Uncharacterized protein n=1 Tax=Hymenobacter mucosus TaxID=1411120 RepID=A0A239AB69_9BACT|nr:hypothetical protein [Hymenobacter mucosus]SNR92789.1 hypothetical protein SAMN06269173_111121 [Hymenobacter mucosus]